jgi:hypothetical protein
MPRKASAKAQLQTDASRARTAIVGSSAICVSKPPARSRSDFNSMNRIVAVCVDAVLLLLLASTVWNVSRGRGNRAGPEPWLSAHPSGGVTSVSIGGTFAPLRDIGPQTVGYVVLVLSENCGACRESLAFYRRLGIAIATQATGGGLTRRVVAVTDDQGSTMEAWLPDNGVSVSRVLHVDDLRALGIRVTPTLILASPDGRVTDLALGRLTAAEEDLCIRRAVGAETKTKLDRSLSLRQIDEGQARQMIHQEGGVVLNVEEREMFAVLKHPGTKNIPLDELRERALAELNPTKPVIVDCLPMEAGICEVTAAILFSEKFRSVWSMKR